MTGTTHLLAVQAKLTEKDAIIRQLRAQLREKEHTNRLQVDRLVMLQQQMATLETTVRVQEQRMSALLQRELDQPREEDGREA